MTLDFMILGEKDEPLSSLPLSIEQHCKIINASKAFELKEFSRMVDYYKDYQIPIEKLDPFIIEVDFLIKKLSDEHLNLFLMSLKELIKSAKIQDRPIDVVAD